MDNQPEVDFHVMDYVRKVRAEANELYLRDKKQYMARLEAATEDFLLRYARVHSSHSIKNV